MAGFAFLNTDDKPIVFTPGDVNEYTGEAQSKTTMTEIREML